MRVDSSAASGSHGRVMLAPKRLVLRRETVQRLDNRDQQAHLPEGVVGATIANATCGTCMKC